MRSQQEIFKINSIGLFHHEDGFACQISALYVEDIIRCAANRRAFLLSVAYSRGGGSPITTIALVPRIGVCFS